MATRVQWRHSYNLSGALYQAGDVADLEPETAVLVVGAGFAVPTNAPLSPPPESYVTWSQVGIADGGLPGPLDAAGDVPLAQLPVGPAATQVAAGNHTHGDLAPAAHIHDYVPNTARGTPLGVATLDGAGRIPNAQVPPLAITDTYPVTSQAAMLALDAQRGDVAVRTDGAGTFILRAEPAATLANWELMRAPTDAVTSVDGRVGVVTLADLYLAASARAAAGGVASLDAATKVPIGQVPTGAVAGTVALGDHTHGAGGGGYSTVQEEGTALPQRTTVNFVGGGATATDDLAAARTTVTIPAAPAPIEVFPFSRAGALTVAAGTSRIYLDAAYALETVRVGLGAAPAGAALIVDVNYCPPGGTPATIYGTQANRPSVPAGSNTAAGGATSVAAFASGGYLTVDVDQVGSTTPGSDLTVVLRLRRA